MKPFSTAAVVFFVVGLSSNIQPALAYDVLPSPSDDPAFLVLPDGTDLKKVVVRKRSLRMQTGYGTSFGEPQWQAYRALKAQSQDAAQPEYPIQWVLSDLQDEKILAQSLNPEKLFFGASVSKIFVAATLLHRNKSKINRWQLTTMADMIVISSNPAWLALQRSIGGGVKLWGQQRIHAFTQKMGYLKTRGFQGWMKDEHGNELNADELNRFMYDTYHGRYEGAETLWKLMFTSVTGKKKAKRYLPDSLFVGGKSGTYHGKTVDPVTDNPKNPDGTPYTVKVRHHVITFNYGDRNYSMAILTNRGKDEEVALMAGGLFREYISQ